MKKLICILLCTFLTICSALPVFALEESNVNTGIVTPKYVYTSKVTSALDITSKTATCSSKVIAIDGVTKITVTQELQKKSGSTWTSIYGWGKTVFQVATGFTNKKTDLDSGTYRVKTIAKVYNGSNYETVTGYSTTKTC